MRVVNGEMRCDQLKNGCETRLLERCHLCERLAACERERLARLGEHALVACRRVLGSGLCLLARRLARRVDARGGRRLGRHCRSLGACRARLGVGDSSGGLRHAPLAL